MSETPETPNPKEPKPQPQTGCGTIILLVIPAVMGCALVFNTFVLLFPLFAILFIILNHLFCFVRREWGGSVIVGILLACFLSPIDIALRPSPHPRITVLPQVQCRDSFQIVRILLEKGQRENIDFIVARSGCSGPTYPKTAVIFFYPSRYTTHFGTHKTPEEAEKAVQQTLKNMKEWKQRQQERKQAATDVPT